VGRFLDPEAIMNTVRKKAPNPVDQYVGSRVRVRRMMLAMSQTNLGSALDLPAQGTFSHYIPLQCMLPAKREQDNGKRRSD
jgi:hypothetical protein